MTDLKERNDFQERAATPVLMGLGLLAVIAVTILLTAFVLLNVTREIALVFASVLAAGILGSIALYASKDELTSSQRAVASLPAVLPLLIGVAVAGGLGGLADADLNINRLPIEVGIPFPADNSVTVVASDSIDFETESLTFPSGEEAVGILFQNNEAGVAHNVWIATQKGSIGESRALPNGELILDGGDAVTGVSEIEYAFTTAGISGDFVFWCTVHPNMEGPVTIGEDLELSAT